mmetsp:Transcript_23129/g.52163  ORF Transcript_23129/g.52163 Transcript_23129/m.52163 type:complete len:313 (+) Transcript_23129:1-939(+)
MNRAGLGVISRELVDQSVVCFVGVRFGLSLSEMETRGWVASGIRSATNPPGTPRAPQNTPRYLVFQEWSRLMSWEVAKKGNSQREPPQRARGLFLKGGLVAFPRPLSLCFFQRFDLSLKGRHALQQPADRLRHVLSKDVGFEVDFPADGFLGHHDLGLGVGHQHETKPAPFLVHLTDGEARAVDGDEPLGHHQPHQVGRGSHLDPEGLSVGLLAQDGPGAVHVALHEVARVPPIRGERTLEVHALPRREVAEVAPPQRLWREPDFESVLVENHDGRTHTVDRNGGALVGPVEDYPTRTPNHKLRALAHTSVP